MCYCPTPTLHLNLALTGDGAFLFSLKKTHSVWFISVLNYGDTENVLINHLLLVIPMSYPCHYTNLCPHKPHKHAHTHTHTHTHLFLCDIDRMKNGLIVRSGRVLWRGVRQRVWGWPLLQAHSIPGHLLKQITAGHRKYQMRIKIIKCSKERVAI